MKKAIKCGMFFVVFTVFCLCHADTSAAFVWKRTFRAPDLELGRQEGDAGPENQAEDVNTEKQEEKIEGDIEEDIEVEDWGGNLGEDEPQEELEALIEQYFQEMETAQLPDGQQEAEKIVDPELLMEMENDGRISYRFPNMGYFTSTVPNGMISSQPVELTLSPGCAAIIDCDGVSSTLTSSKWFTEGGNYHIRILSYQSPEESVQDYDLYETNLYFTIIESPNNCLGAVPAPEGFQITEVTLDGKIQKVEHPRCFFLTGDGQYTIQYTAQSDEKLQLETSFIRDTAAPFLLFSQELEEGTAYGMLEFYPSEEDCRISMNYNGEYGYAVSNQLTVAGYYRLVIEDEAGNHREYSLRIKPNYSLFDTRIIAMGAVLLLAVGVWMFSQRKNMRVL